MKSYSKVTPEGTRDILFEECRARREVQRKLATLFSLRGYHEVMTPGLEYYDVFRLPGMGIPQQEMYKVTDNHGRLVVFRPDSTLPIARMAAARLQGHRLPLRLYYNQNVYRNRPDFTGRSDEEAQMGIELMGAGGLKADLEAIALAVEVMESCGEDFRIEIGHARLFHLLADRLPITQEEKEEIRATIEAKNDAALSDLLQPLGEGPEVEAMRNLPRLFGGEEALAAAESACSQGEAAQVLAYLKSLYAALSQMGLENKLMVDLGLVQRNEYYTGVVFSAYLHRHGDAVLVGGRYDSLCGRFGTPMPAVGFAADVEALAAGLEGISTRENRALVFGEQGFEMDALLFGKELGKQGIFWENATGETLEEAVAYAKSQGIGKIIVLGEGRREILVEEEVQA